MTSLVEGAFTITNDEPAYILAEMVLSTPDFHARHRYQVIKVIRGDKLVEWRLDLGDARLYPAREFFLVGGDIDKPGGDRCYESVGRLREIADEMRGRTGHIEGDFEQTAVTDWLGAYHDELDRRKRRTRRIFTPRRVA